MQKLVVGIVALLVVALSLLAFTQGPEGTAIAKDVDAHIQSASDESALHLVEVRSVSPQRVALPLPQR